MGNQNAKEKDQKLFSADEMKVIEGSFRAVGGHSTLTREKLLESWAANIDSHLAHCTANFLFKVDRDRLPSITLKRYSEAFYIVEHGTNDDKLNFLAASMEKTDSSQFAVKELENYVTSVVRSYLSMEQHCHSKVFNDWKVRGFQSAERTILAFAKGVIRSVSVTNEHRFDLMKLERWLLANPTFVLIWRDVFAHLYSKNSGKSFKLGSDVPRYILPSMEGLAKNSQYAPVLDIPHVIFLNSNLPHAMRHKWRFLFSSKIMGESFSTMMGKIIHKGPTLLIVEDEDRFVFAGFAPEAWELKPVFAGNDTSMLFALSPAMRCFNATGYNNHYQYLNINQQTMPNGLGMGGQFNFWGLWLDREYGTGQSSESCTTYRDYKQLSKRKDFRIRSVEVWGIGDEPKPDDSDEEQAVGKGSVLDQHMEDRVMLELAGKTMHSEGLHEPPLD